LTSSPEIIAITRALLQLSTAMSEMGRAVTALTQSQNDVALTELEAVGKAVDSCLQYLKVVVDLVEKDRE
jgi:hypothetical protein